MINGVHLLLYSRDPDVDREFFLICPSCDCATT